MNTRGGRRSRPLLHGIVWLSAASALVALCWAAVRVREAVKVFASDGSAARTVAANAALSQLHDCFNGRKPWPPLDPPRCLGWNCPNASTCWKVSTDPRTPTESDRGQLCLVATWPGGVVQVDACPFSGLCPTACP